MCFSRFGFARRVRDEHIHVVSVSVLLWSDADALLPPKAAGRGHRRYQCNDGEWRPLEVFFRETHEAWLPFCSDEDLSDSKDISLLQSAWCNCKAPLLETLVQ